MIFYFFSDQSDLATGPELSRGETSYIQGLHRISGAIYASLRWDKPKVAGCLHHIEQIVAWRWRYHNIWGVAYNFTIFDFKNVPTFFRPDYFQILLLISNHVFILQLYRLGVWYIFPPLCSQEVLSMEWHIMNRWVEDPEIGTQNDTDQSPLF
jgi:hypothetical protein